MQKEVVEKRVQKARHCMATKSTQPTICTLTLSSTTLQLRTHTMRRYIKLTSASSITSLVGLSWHTIPAGYHNYCNFYHCSCLIYFFLLVGLKHFQHAQSSLITLLRCAELGCLKLNPFSNGGTSAHVLSAQAGTIIAACTKSFLVGSKVPLLFSLF